MSHSKAVNTLKNSVPPFLWGIRYKGRVPVFDSKESFLSLFYPTSFTEDKYNIGLERRMKGAAYLATAMMHASMYRRELKKYKVHKPEDPPLQKFHSHLPKYIINPTREQMQDIRDYAFKNFGINEIKVRNVNSGELIEDNSNDEKINNNDENTNNNNNDENSNIESNNNIKTSIENMKKQMLETVFYNKMNFQRFTQESMTSTFEDLDTCFDREKIQNITLERFQNVDFEVFREFKEIGDYFTSAKPGGKKMLKQMRDANIELKYIQESPPAMILEYLDIFAIKIIDYEYHKNYKEIEHVQDQETHDEFARRRAFEALESNYSIKNYERIATEEFDQLHLTPEDEFDFWTNDSGENGGFNTEEQMIEKIELLQQMEEAEQIVDYNSASNDDFSIFSDKDDKSGSKGYPTTNIGEFNDLPDLEDL